MRGGYKIIDLRGENLSESPVIIPGIYESIEENYYKPLLLISINIDGVERAGAFASPDNDGSAYIFSGVYGGTITISDDDTVTYIKS